MACSSQLLASESRNADLESKAAFQTSLETFLNKSSEAQEQWSESQEVEQNLEGKLPLIDLQRLELGEVERSKCKKEIVEASREWGFFQVCNHGVSRELLERLAAEEVKLFQQPFEKKKTDKLFDFSTGTYSWGSPRATTLQQFSWSEAFHIPLAAALSKDCDSTLRSTIEEYAGCVSKLALQVAEILVENLGEKVSYFAEKCRANTCYVRMNRYPPCPEVEGKVFGLMPHTDSDFLTILYQDRVGGLELLKQGSWITVKPIPDALIINIGDLFQAWSNGGYRSVEHRVMTNNRVERFSVAYFMCPSYDTVIESFQQPPLYKKFSFGEFRQQVQQDVRTMGYKIGLPRFLIQLPPSPPSQDHYIHT